MSTSQHPTVARATFDSWAAEKYGRVKELEPEQRQTFAARSSSGPTARLRGRAVTRAGWNCVSSDAVAEALADGLCWRRYKSGPRRRVEAPPRA